MRIEGRLTRWNDEKGFGFLTPRSGGDDVFVHIKAFPARGGRPQLNEFVSFEVELDARGKKRASKVARVEAVRAASHRSPAAQWGTASLFAIPAFVLLFLAIAFLWQVPGYVPLIYIVASAVAFVAYWQDKAAANSGGWRTPESTLHFLGFAGGWPGALLAQQFLRHKSVKAEFRAMFWATVVANVLGFVLFASPFGRSILQQLS